MAHELWPEATKRFYSFTEKMEKRSQKQPVRQRCQAQALPRPRWIAVFHRPGRNLLPEHLEVLHYSA